MFVSTIQSLLAIFGVALLCLFPLTIFAFIIFAKIFRILAARHSDKYQELGSPTLFVNNTISNGFRFQRFLFKKEYRELNDPELTRLGNIGHVLILIGVVVFIGFAVSYIATGVFVGPPSR